MKTLRILFILCFTIVLASSSILGQTIKQFNGILQITTVKATSSITQITGSFSDPTNTFTTSNIAVDDEIIDPNGNAFRIITIGSISGTSITVVVDKLNKVAPTIGKGIIYRPTSNGYPLIAQNTPAAILNTAVNTSSISINSDLPSFESGTALPTIDYNIGDVIRYSGDSKFYQLGSSGWTQLSTAPVTNTSTSITSVPVAAAGTIVYMKSLVKFYISDGTTWINIAMLSELPTIPSFGDVFYVTGENALYMLADDGAGNLKWMAISNSGISGGGNADFPINPKPGSLFFNTDNNTLYLYDNTSTWVEVSTNGSTPADLTPPDPTTSTVKEGRLFYNTSEHQLYVFNGTVWIPVGNSLPESYIYVGNSSNIASPVPMSGDATIDNIGKFTINNQAITDAKLDKSNIPLSGFGNPKANVNMGDGTTNYRISNLLTPSATTDAATKGYVDNMFATPSSSLALLYNNLFIGNPLNKAIATPKASIPLSGFGNPTANISMNGKLITNLASPSNGTDAANKDYVDTKQIYPIDISLYYNMLLVGNAQDQAGMVEKKDIPFSDFGAGTKDVSFGGFKATNLAEPAVAQDAATKNYVDTKVFPATNIALTSGSLLVGNSSGKAAETLKNAIPLSGFGAAGADVSMGSFKINNLATPTADTDASNKKYVDDLFLSPSNMLALPAGNLFVGNALGKAAPTLKSSVPISGFGKATDNVYMGDASTKYMISYLADPLSAQDAATKNYVDTKTANPSSITLAVDNILVGNAANQAEAILKSNVSLSDFGGVKANLSLGSYKITDLGDPVSDGDAVNKKYITTQLSTVTSTLALPSGQLYVGSVSNKATATAKNTIPLSGFGAAAADVALGGFKLTSVADPAADQDAATKKYVDGLMATVNSTLSLAKGNMLVGDASGKAASVAKSAISISGFGDAEANVSMGTGSNNYKIINLATPTGDMDAATKKYVDDKTGGVTTTKPTTPTVGATYYDTTTKTFYVYDGSNWIPVDNKLPKDELYVGDANGNAAATAKNTIPLSGFGAAAADVALGGFKLTGVADPVANQDAATKKYVDDKTGGVTTTKPTTPTVGATYYDTTTKTFYVYDGSNWIPVDNKLPKDELYVGDANGNAAATAKNTIPLSGFGAAAADIDLGTHKISNVADPAVDQDAATKKYVDGLMSTVNSTLSLAKGNMLVGDDLGKAASVAKGTISISGFGDAEANVSMGTGSNNYKIINLATPTGDMDAATKKYVDDKTGGVTTTKPTTPTVGATYYDTTTKTFYVYDGSNWIPVDNKLPKDELYVGDANGNAAATAKNTIPLSGFGAAAADVALGGFKLTGVADPAANQDAATKKYVDDKAGSTTTTKPTTPTAGATYYDTTTKTFYVYDGTSWVPVDNKLPKDELYVGDANGNAAATAKNTIPLSGFGAAAADVALGGFKLTGVADPAANQDAATKKYVDDKAGSTTTTKPTTPTAGATYYDTTTKTFYVYDGTSWVPVDNKLPKDELYVGDANGNAAATAKNTIPLSGFGAAAADVALGGFKLTGVADPAANQDAATKKYVDDKAGSTTTTKPTTPTAGATYYDTTTKTFYVYDGTGWVPVDNKLPKDELYVGDANGNAAATAKNTIPLSGFGAAAADVALGGFKLTGVADPAVDQDAATKKYVDGLMSTVNSTLSLAKGNMLVGDDFGKAASTPKSSISISGFRDAEANVSMGTGSNNYKIINVADPTGDQDAATKKYVDSKAGTTTKPTNPQPGATYYDTTTKTLYVYDGTGWVSAVTGDNLGNHTATKNIQMATFAINSDGADGKGLSFETVGNATFAQDVTVKGNFYTPSDLRLKTNIETLGNVLQKIDSMRGVRFEYKDQKKYAKGPKIGVIAQELMKVYPEMVTKGVDGFFKVDYTQLTAALIQAVKEQQQKMKQQQLEINELNSRLDKQQLQIDAILKKMN